jgi:hypothetical protein
MGFGAASLLLSAASVLRKRLPGAGSAVVPGIIAHDISGS